jgi:hypothetical protein
VCVYIYSFGACVPKVYYSVYEKKTFLNRISLKDERRWPKISRDCKGQESGDRSHMRERERERERDRRGEKEKRSLRS